MGMDNISDKVNINVGEGRSGGDSGAMAALVAALGNRNQGDNSAALIAALGTRNSDSQLAPLMAMMNGNNRDRDGLGEMWPLLLLLMGRGRGGFGGGGDDCCDTGHRDVSPAHAALLQTLLEGQSDLKAAVPTAALETTNAIQSSIAQLALGLSQGLANVKDSVQNGATANLIATKDVAKDIAVSTLQTQIAITADGERTRELLVKFNNDDLQRQLTVAQTALSEERIHRHSDGNRVEVNQSVNNTATAVSAQMQQQQQQQAISELGHLVRDLVGDIQAVKQGQVIFNSGLMSGSGTQAAANTKVA